MEATDRIQADSNLPTCDEVTQAILEDRLTPEIVAAGLARRYRDRGHVASAERARKHALQQLRYFARRVRSIRAGASLRWSDAERAEHEGAAFGFMHWWADVVRAIDALFFLSSGGVAS